MAYQITGNITKNFTLEEIANKQAKETVKLVLTPEIVEHAMMMQELRDVYGKPITVNSWYRTKTFNNSLGGSASNSAHLDGLATDIKLHPEDYKKVTEWWRTICSRHKKIGGINYYTNGVHLCSDEGRFGNKSFITRDYRGTKNDW